MGEAHSSKRVRRKYTPAQRQEMAERYQAGQMLKAISEAMACPLPTVWWILREAGIHCRPSGEYKRGRKHTAEHKAKIARTSAGRKHSSATRRKMSAIAKARGVAHNWFVDGKGKERDTARRQEMDRLQYRLWREAVFARDDYTCQVCGQRGGRLRADHIMPWCGFPDLRYNVANGRTLCDSCHKKTPSYGVHP